jgi:hypothetical protein
MTNFIKFELKRFDFVYILNGLMWTLLFSVGFYQPDPTIKMINASFGVLIIFFLSHHALKIVDRALKPMEPPS